MLKKIFNGDLRLWFVVGGIYPFAVFATYQDTKELLSTADFITASFFGLIVCIIIIHFLKKIEDIVTHRIKSKLKDKFGDTFW